MRSAYFALKRFKVLNLAFRGLLRFAPQRIVLATRQAGIACHFAVYPRRGGELSLIASHEIQAKRHLVEQVNAGDIVLDIGAHFGVYSVLLGKLVGPSGAVHAFEPHPTNRERLQENLRINGLNWVTVRPEAISHRTGTIGFNFGNSSTVSSLKALQYQRDDWHQVPTTTVDEYLDNLGLPRVSLVKVDVEGAEDLVLRGMTEVLERDSPTILLELHLRAFSGSQVADLIDGLFRSRSCVGEIVYLRSRGSWQENELPPRNRFTDSETLLRAASQSDNAGVLLTKPG